MRLNRRFSFLCFSVLVFAGPGSVFLGSQTPSQPHGDGAPYAPEFFTSADSTAPINLTAGGSLRTVTLSLTGANGFTGTVAVTAVGMPSGVTASPSSFSLTAGQSQPVTLTASSAAVGKSTMIFNATSAGVTRTLSIPVTVKVDYVTFHFDNGRTGLNPNEDILTQTSVSYATFGMKHFLPVDGLVDAEPLLLSNISIGGTLHDLVFVETEHDSVYAFDANSGAPIWQVSTIGANETTTPPLGCDGINIELGITATPVIDRNAGPNGAIFLESTTTDLSNIAHHRLHALDVTTGADLANSPTEIAATFPGTGDDSTNGTAIFNPGHYLERTGLLLLNGTIYMGWASHCDRLPYTGWLMGYSESTLAQTSVLDLTPNGGAGSIWMSGGAMAADSSGNIYFLDANGTFDPTLNSQGFPTRNNFGNAFIKVSTANGTLAVADYFETYDGPQQSLVDTDFGSGGAIVLPDVVDSQGTTHHLAVGAGKDHNIYVVNRDSMGKFDLKGNNIFEQIAAFQSGVWSTPAYISGKLYCAPAGGYLQLFNVIPNGKFDYVPLAKTGNWYPYPGATPSITANGIKNGVVWVISNSSPAVLRAYRDFDLKLLYDSHPTLGRDAFGNGNKYMTPMIANGQVYVGTPNGVAVFGLLN